MAGAGIPALVCSWIYWMGWMGNNGANGRGGPRPIHHQARCCPYCQQQLDLWCQARWVYRWSDGTIPTLMRRLVCRRQPCVDQAAAEGWA